MKTLKKYNVKKEEWQYQGRWEQSPFSSSFWVHWYDQSTSKRLGLPSLDGGLIRIEGHQILKKEDFDILHSYIQKVCDKKDSKWNYSFKKEVINLLDEHRSIIPLLGKNNSSYEVLEKFVKSCKKVMVAWLTVAIFSNYLDEKIREITRGQNVDLTAVMRSTPYKETPLVIQYREALNIKKVLKKAGLLDVVKESIPKALKEIQKQGRIWEELQNHVKKYEWLRTHHFAGEPLSVESLLEEILILEEKGETTLLVSITKDIEFIVSLLWNLSFLRENIVATFNMVAYKTRPLLIAIGKNFGLKYDELTLLTSTEISAYLKTKTKPVKTKLMKRKRGYAILITDENEVVIDDSEELNELIGALVPRADLGVSEIKGIVASKGSAKGIVKVFLVPKGMEKMQEGDILVTTMTTPDFVPLMQKSAAIVTDIGGLLSHAAIISREFKIPCIVGTQFATKIFKDGDLVEVDAEKGVVRKISQT